MWWRFGVMEDWLVKSKKNSIEEKMLHSKAEMETLLEGVQLWIFGRQSSLLGFLCQRNSLWIRPLKFWEKPARGVPKVPIHWEMVPSVIILWCRSKAHLPLRRSQGCWLPGTSIEAVSCRSLLGGAYKYQGNELPSLPCCPSGPSTDKA